MSPFMAIYRPSERLDREATPLNSKEIKRIDKRKKRLKKTESYYKLLILKTKDKCSFASRLGPGNRLKFRVVLLIDTYPYPAAAACCLLVVLGGHADSAGCLGARKYQGLRSSRRFVR